MKKIAIAAALSAFASTAFAGSLAEPVVEPEVIVEEASSSSTGMMIPLILLLLIGLVMHHQAQ